MNFKKDFTLKKCPAEKLDVNLLSDFEVLSVSVVDTDTQKPTLNIKLRASSNLKFKDCQNLINIY